ncbi:hypothetical protein ACHAXT_000825 [Thalassiosira profunda]
MGRPCGEAGSPPLQIVLGAFGGLCYDDGASGSDSDGASAITRSPATYILGTSYFATARVGAPSSGVSRRSALGLNKDGRVPMEDRKGAFSQFKPRALLLSTVRVTAINISTSMSTFFSDQLESEQNVEKRVEAGEITPREADELNEEWETREWELCKDALPKKIGWAILRFHACTAIMRFYEFVVGRYVLRVDGDRGAAAIMDGSGGAATNSTGGMTHEQAVTAMDKLTRDPYQASKRTSQILHNQEHSPGKVIGVDGKETSTSRELTRQMFTTCLWANIIPFLAELTVQQGVLIYGYGVYYRAKKRRDRRREELKNEGEEEQCEDEDDGDAQTECIDDTAYALSTSLAVSLTNPTTASNQTSANGFATMALDSDDAPATYPTEMSEAERYLFDLNGFLVVRNVLTPEEVAACHAAIDNHADEAVARSDPTLRNAVEGSPMYGSGPPRLDLGGIFEWGEIESRVFKKVLAHPRLLPLFHGLLGKGYRLDHIPFVLMNNKGGEGFQLHGGTVDCVSGEYNSNLAYTCHNGSIRSNLLGCNVMLVDHNPGDGGFCVVPGSHKSNFKTPPGMVDGLCPETNEAIIQPATKAGDVVLFSEGTVHGAMGWNSDTQRRCALYRFAPATMGYGRSYFSGESGTAWPAKFYDDTDLAQRSVLEPPYANRLDRPNILEDGSVEITQRSERKRQHDNDVFKTKYF